MKSLTGKKISMMAVALSLVTAGLGTAAYSADEPQPVVHDGELMPALPALPDASPGLIRIGTDEADRMTVPVKIGDAGPYPFMIDTGSHRSIVATELARHLDLQSLPPVTIISMAGRATVDSVHLEQMEFGNQSVSNLSALSIARDALGTPGLIGLDSLRNKRLTLDFRKRQMTVDASVPLAPEANTDSNLIVVKARSRLGQLILVDSKLDGRKVNVILDTGAEISVGNMALYNRLKTKRMVVPPQDVIMTAVTGQKINAKFAVVRRLEIETVKLENVPMVFVDAAPFEELGLSTRPSMLLGMKMLRMFDRVAIDFGNRHIDFLLPQSNNGTDQTPIQLAGL